MLLRLIGRTKLSVLRKCATAILFVATMIALSYCSREMTIDSCHR